MECTEHDGRVYVASRDGHVLPAGAVRVRRTPNDATDIESLSSLMSSESLQLTAGGDSPVDGAHLVWREFRELEPSLLLGREQFGNVEQAVSARPDPESRAPAAQASPAGVQPTQPTASLALCSHIG